MLYGLLLLGAIAIPLGWRLTANIRQSRQNKQPQQASEQRYEALAGAVPVGIFRSNAASQCSYVNECWCQITGHTPEMAAEEGWQQTLHPEDRPVVAAEWTQAIQENRSAQMEYRIQRPDGTTVWVYGQIVAERDANGQVVGYVGTLTDINKRKCSEQGLQQSEAHYRALVNVLPDLVMRLSREGVFLEFLASPNFRVLGEPADWIGTHVSETLPPALAQERLRVIEAVLRTRTMQVYEQDFSVEGEIQVEEVRAVPYGENEVLFLVRDVSDRQHAEQSLRRSEAQSQAILSAIPDYLVRLGADGIYRELAVPEREFALVPSTGIAGRSIDEVLPAEMVSRRRRYLQKALQTGELQIYEQTVQIGDRIQEEEVRVVKSGEDEALFIIRDIGDRKQAEATIRRNEQRLGNIAANIPGVIIQYVFHSDGSDEATYVSLGCYDLWELTPEELVANSQVLWDLIPAEDRAGIRASIAVSARMLEPWKCQCRIVTPSGRVKWLEASGRPERHDNGDIVWDMLILDVSERIRIEEQLKHDALYDSLTGLPNRMLLIERLTLALALADRHPNYQFAVLFLDLDNFKVINDSLGHQTGDELLLKVSGLLADIIRETDLAARLGGDEFVVLLDGLEDTQEAERVAERILTLLRSPLQVSGHEVFIGTSIGIVVGTAHYQSAEELLRDSDLAMYQAKHSGRGCYAVFESAMHLRAVQRLQMENDLRKALGNKELVLYYQPIVCLINTEAIQGFEALIRWQHPTGGLLLPEEFVEIAEETGLIDPIGEWILEGVCQQLEQWQTQFPGLFLSLNLSVKQLKPSLLQQLKRVLTIYQFEPHSLIFEVTEGMLAQNFDDTVELLEEIKAQNVCISIDDFGTGYSSLSYLHRLPVDILKVDRAFISPAEPNSRNQSIAESIITLSNLLALKVVAEGVETAQQLAWLQTLGCELGQGRFFSPPVPAEQATQLLIQKG